MLSVARTCQVIFPGGSCAIAVLYLVTASALSSSVVQLSPSSVEYSICVPVIDPLPASIDQPNSISAAPSRDPLVGAVSVTLGPLNSTEKLDCTQSLSFP